MIKANDSWENLCCKTLYFHETKNFSKNFSIQTIREHLIFAKRARGSELSYWSSQPGPQIGPT